MAGRYQAYLEYKDSEVEWLGSIPSHWARLPLKYITGNKVKDGPHETPKFIDDGVPFLSVDGIQNNELVFDGCRHVSKEDHLRFSLKCRPTEGDVLLGKAASVGKVAYVDTSCEFNVWSPLAVITPKVKTSGRFIFYSIQSAAVQAQCDLRSNSNTQKNLGMADIDSLFFAAPNIVEQASIVDFLDHETAKIDTLIDKQQQLVKLLREKRQAVISHAVTKGLNPDAPMKDSGVEWLGEVPEHWEISPLKFQTMEMQTGPFGSQLHSEDYVESEIPLINPAHMMDGHIVPSSSCTVDKVTQERLSRHKLKEGDLILARRGELGRCAVIKPEHVGWLCGTGSLKATLINSLRPDYAYMLISSEGVKVELSLESKGSTMENLNTETLGNIRLPVPPVTEQDKILQFVSKIDLKYERLYGLALEQIDLLRERRTALISAAVTGKIDVRNWKVKWEAGWASSFVSKEGKS